MSEVEATSPAVADPLARARKEASGALCTLAFLQFAAAALLALLPRWLGATVDPAAMALALGWTAGLGAIYAALGVWARSRPLPAGAVGLGLLLVLTAVTLPERLGMGSVVQLLVQLVLAALLVKAIRTCWLAKRTSVHQDVGSAGGAGCEVTAGARGMPGAEL